MSKSRALIASLAGLLITLLFAGQAFAGSCIDGKASFAGLLRDGGSGSPVWFMENFKDIVTGGGTISHFAWIQLGDPNDIAVSGQWVDRGTEVGNSPGEGPDTLGLYRSSNQTFYLVDDNPAAPSLGDAEPATPTVSIDAFAFGIAGDQPVAGNWNGDTQGTDEVGVYRESASVFLLGDANSSSAGITSIALGAAGDTPLAGQFDSVAGDDVAVARVESGAVLTFYLRDSNGDVVVQQLGTITDQPLVGDWDGNGIDTIGIYRPSGNTFYLSNQEAGGAVGVDIQMQAGDSGDVGMAGGWWGHCPAP